MCDDFARHRSELTRNMEFLPRAGTVQAAVAPHAYGRIFGRAANVGRITGNARGGQRAVKSVSGVVAACRYTDAPKTEVKASAKKPIFHMEFVSDEPERLMTDMVYFAKISARAKPCDGAQG
jgi:hypothetical protein